MRSQDAPSPRCPRLGPRPAARQRARIAARAGRPGAGPGCGACGRGWTGHRKPLPARYACNRRRRPCSKATAGSSPLLCRCTKALAQLRESSCPASRKLLASFTKALSQLHESSCPASRKLLPSFAKALSQLHGRRQAESSLRLMSSSGQQRCLLLATAASAQRSCTLRPVPSMGGLTAPGARGCRPARGGLCTQTGPAAGRHRALWVWQYHQGPA